MPTLTKRGGRGVAVPILNFGARKGGRWSLPHSGQLTTGESPGAHCTGGLMSPKAHLFGCG